MTGGAIDMDDRDIGPIASIMELLRSRCENCKYKAAKDGKAQESGNATVYTYFIKAGNKIKIGKSVDVVRRCEALSHHMPSNPRLLHYTTLVSEAEVHKRFCGLRVHGEWFKITNALLAYIEELIARDKAHDQQNT